jgi:hypothetical protein
MRKNHVDQLFSTKYHLPWYSLIYLHLFRPNSILKCLFFCFFQWLDEPKRVAINLTFERLKWIILTKNSKVLLQLFLWQILFFTFFCFKPICFIPYLVICFLKRNKCLFFQFDSIFDRSPFPIWHRKKREKLSNHTGHWVS